MRGYATKESRACPERSRSRPSVREGYLRSRRFLAWMQTVRV